MRTKRSKGIFILTVLLCLLFGSIAVYADEDEKDVPNNDFIVKAEVGIDSVAVEYRATPVAVTVRNLGKDFEGKLRIVIPATYDQSSLAYEKSITVPSAGEKTFSVLLPDIQNTSFLRIELVNNRGKIVYSERQTYVSLSTRGQEAIVGILSSDYTGLNYFDGVTILAGSYGVLSSKIIQLTSDTIPDVAAGLDLCDYILIDNYNTSQLSEAQCQAIMAWVNNGGVLIIGTGSKASTALEGFQDSYLPMKAGNLTKRSLTVTANDVYTVENVDVAEYDNPNWIDMQSQIASGAPAWMTAYGGGSIMVLSYDLAMNPIANWKVGRSQLASNILSYAATDEQYSRITLNGNGKFNEYNIKEITSGVDKNKIPNSLLYGLIFFIYVIAIGPAAYLVLRAMDKREKLWIVMPCIALGFTMIILLTSMMYKIHKPFIDTFAVVEYNHGLKSTTNYMRIQSPKGKEYDVDLNEEYQEVSSWNQDVDYSMVGTTDYEYAIEDKGSNLTLHMMQKMAFSGQNLAAKKQEYTEDAGFVTNFRCTMNGIEGEVSNQTGYDLTNVVVCYYDKYVYVGDMKNGDKAVIQMTDNEDRNALMWDASNWMADTPSSLDDFQRLFFRNERDEALRINQSVYQMIRDNVDALEISQGMVFGMIDDYDPDLVDSYKVKVYNCGLALAYFQQVPEEYQQYSMFVDDITDYMVGGDNITYTSVYDSRYEEDFPNGFAYFYNTDDLYMNNDVMDVLYDFSGVDISGAFLLNKDAQADDSSILTEEDFDNPNDYEEYLDDLLNGYISYDGYAATEIYNWERKQFEKIFENGDDTVANLKPYIDESGCMLIRYTNEYSSSADAYYDCYAPHISLIGGEQ